MLKVIEIIISFIICMYIVEIGGVFLLSFIGLKFGMKKNTSHTIKKSSDEDLINFYNDNNIK